jgi:hypothetical protein
MIMTSGLALPDRLQLFDRRDLKGVDWVDKLPE